MNETTTIEQPKRKPGRPAKGDASSQVDHFQHPDIPCTVNREFEGEDRVYTMTLGAHTVTERTAVEPTMLWLKNFLINSAQKLYKLA